jgi:glycosyltransferase involved in cell wall biosynthesis
MKVLNIIQRYYPARGGAELFIQILSEYQANELDYEVDVWTSNAKSANTLWDLDGDIVTPEVEEINGVKVYRFELGSGILKNKYINKIFRVLFGRFPSFKLSNIATCPTTFGMLDKVKSLEKGDYDVVTVSSTPYYFLFYIGYLVSKKLDIPLIIAPAFHVGLNRKSKLGKKYFKKGASRFFAHAKKIILNTRAEGQAIKDFCRTEGVLLDDAKFEVVGQGIFLEEVEGGDGLRFRKKYNVEGPIVFQVGSKNYEKGSMSLIGAMKKVWDDGVEATLVFAGGANTEFDRYLDGLDGKYRERILNIDNIPEQDKWDLYDAGDIFSMVSKTDSFGIVYLEAWAYSKPVLGCKNDVIKEIIDDGENGYLVNFDDIETFSEKIKSLLANPEKKEKMGRKGREKLEERYTWDKNLKKIDRIYEGLDSN